MNEVQNEIDDMLKVMGSGHIVESKNEEEVKEEEVVEEKEEVIEEEKPDKEEIEEEVKEEKEEPEPDERDKIIEDLRRQVAEKPPEKKEEKKEEPLKLDEQDFIGDLDIDEVIRDKSEFNKLLNSVYSKGVTDAKKVTSENVLSSLPDIVKNNINLINTLKETSDNFYKTNKDLEPFKKVVATVFEEVAAANVDKTYIEVMSLVAPETRKKLGLPEPKVDQKASKKEDKPPRLPEKKGGNKSSPTEQKTSPLQNDIDEMNKVVRR
jgi:hypothetical protein